MTADDDAERQAFAACDGRLIDVLQIAHGDEVDAGFVAAAQHQAAQTDVGPAGCRVHRDVERGGDVRAAVAPVLHVHRQLRDVGVGAGEDHLLHRRLRARQLDEFRFAL